MDRLVAHFCPALFCTVLQPAASSRGCMRISATKAHPMPIIPVTWKIQKELTLGSIDHVRSVGMSHPFFPNFPYSRDADPTAGRLPEAQASRDDIKRPSKSRGWVGTLTPILVQSGSQSFRAEAVSNPIDSVARPPNAWTRISLPSDHLASDTLLLDVLIFSAVKRRSGYYVLDE